MVLFACAIVSISGLAQVANDSTGVAVAIKLHTLGWQYSAPTFSASASITALNGTHNTDPVFSPDTASNQIIARLAVGKSYTLTVTQTGLVSGKLLVMPPSGYIMEIEGVARDQYSLDGATRSVQLRVRPPKSTAPQRAGESTALGVERTLWQVSLGALSNGDSAGTLSFIDVGVGSDVASLFSPMGLVYDAPSSEVHAIMNPSSVAAPYIAGTLRQIIAPQACIDVVTTATDKCELKFYHRAQLGAVRSDGTYSFSGDPFVWYFFNQTGAEPNSVNVRADIRNTTSTSGELVTTSVGVTRSKVTTLTRSGTAPEYTWIASDWYTNSTGQVSLSTSKRVIGGAGETLTTYDPNAEGTPAVASLSRTYSTMPWGTEVTSESQGSANQITTQYDFPNDTLETSAAYARLRSRTTHGQWEEYEYYDYADSIALAGQIKAVHRPFDSTCTTVPALDVDDQQITSYTYGVDAYGRATRVTGMTTTVGGSTTGNSTITYTESAAGITGHTGLVLVTVSQTDYSRAGESLTSQRKYFREDAGDTEIFDPTIYPYSDSDDFFRGQTYSSTQPNGVKLSYLYQRGSWNGSSFSASGNFGADAVDGIFASRICVIAGVVSGAGTACTTCYDAPIDAVYLVTNTSEAGVTKCQSTMIVTIRDNYARVIRTEKHVWDGASWNLVEAINHKWNFANQLLRTARNQSSSYDLSTGVIAEASYDGERLTEETAGDGRKTSYAYDTADRVETRTMAAAGTDDAGRIGAVTDKFTYDALGHVRGVETGNYSAGVFTGETIKSSRGYDTAGRLTSEAMPGPNGALTTGYAYDPANRKVTTTFPDKSTRVEVVNPNGAPASITGTGVVAQYYDYTVATGGLIKTRVSAGSSASVRYQEAWTDWLGRTTKSSRPGFGSPSPSGTAQSPFIEEAVYTAGTGFLSKKTRTGFADTLYEPDSFGRVKRMGLSLGSTSSLVPASDDRIVDTETYYAKENGSWWQVTKLRAYPTSKAATALLVSTTKARLTGFSGNVVSESRQIDTHGLTTIRSVEVTDRTNAISTVTTSVLDASQAKLFANDAVETVVAGYSTAYQGFDGVGYKTSYDTLRRKSKDVDPRTGDVTTNYYTGTTYVYSRQDGTSTTVGTYLYDGMGRVATVIDAQGKKRRFEYTLRGELLHQWGTGSYPVEYAYNDYGDRVSMRTFRSGTGWTETGTDISNEKNPWPKDSAGTGDWTIWVYDPASGLLAAKYDAANVDASGKPLAAAKGILLDYSQSGQVTIRTLARGVKVTYGYDGKTGELTSKTYSDHSAPAVTYAYTRSGQLQEARESTFDASGAETVVRSRVLTYDAEDRLEALHLDASNISGLTVPAYSGSRWLTRQYDTAGRAAGFVLGSAKGSSADLAQVYAFNSAGRYDHVTTSNSVEGTARSFVYTYYSYDSRKPTVPLVGGYSAGTFAGTVYTAGNFSVTRTYEANRDLLTSIDSKWSTASQTRYDYQYYANGRRYTAKQSGAAFSEYGKSTYYRYVYNDRGELASAVNFQGDTPPALDATQTIIDALAPNMLPDRQFAFAYDNIGNRQTASRSGTAGAETYTLDATHGPLNQYSERTNNFVRAAGTVSVDTNTVAVTGGGMTWLTGKVGQVWAADAQNLTGVSTDATAKNKPLTVEPSVAATITGNATTASLVQTVTAPVALMAPLHQVFSYDADGNLKGDGIWDYTYDAENRLIALETTSTAKQVLPTSLLMRLEFEYDYLGRRVQKRVWSGWDGTVFTTESFRRRYLYDGDNLVAELTGDGASLTRSFTWGLDLAGSLDASGGVGSLLQITDHSTATSYLPTYDGNGNVAALLRASDGQVSAKYEYSPTGELLHCEGPYAKSNPFRFSTKFIDDETGLIYYGQRYYSPSLGRFINRDPIEETAGFNLYGFCRNDGVNGWDYLGMLTKDVDGGGGDDDDKDDKKNPWPTGERNPDGSYKFTDIIKINGQPVGTNTYTQRGSGWATYTGPLPSIGGPSIMIDLVGGGGPVPGASVRPTPARKTPNNAGLPAGATVANPLQRAQGVNYIAADGTVVLQPFYVNEQKLNSNDNPLFGAVVQGFDTYSTPLNFLAWVGDYGVANGFSAALGPAASAMEAAAMKAAAMSAIEKALSLAASRARAIESLQQRIAEHEAKLAEYLKNPDAFDNKGFLRNAPNDQVRQQIIDGRARHLQNEIDTWKDTIDKLGGGNGGG